MWHKKIYSKAIRHIKNFLEQSKRKHLLVREVTPTVANELKNYLLCAKGENAAKDMTEPLALGNVKSLRTIFNHAIVDGLLEKNPFKTIKLKTVHTNGHALPPAKLAHSMNWI